MGWMKRAGKTDFSGLCVLIAEDNALYAELMMELLALRHATVSRACSGEEAVRMVQDGGGHYDAVLMDVRMPGMDGYEATRAIRALKQNGQVPVFAMTASTDERDRRQALEVGMNAFLGKPLELAAFDEALGQAI